MKHVGAFFVAGAMVAVAAAGCTARDSLLDDAPASGAAGSAGASAQGGSSGGTQPTGGTHSSGGTAGHGGASGGTGGGTGGGPTGGAGTGGAGGASAGAGATGGSATGGTGGTGESGATSAGGTGGGSGTGGTGEAGAGGVEQCSDASTVEECEAMSGCHTVFQDPGTCGCGSEGCCAHFLRCAEGDQADCVGQQVMCDAMTPFCDNPLYVLSYSGTCYEGCVAPKDCAPSCTAPDDPTGCACYANTDCDNGKNCYKADCANHVPGVCLAPPAAGCFGDVDCPSGQTCIGGHLAACGSGEPNSFGTCGGEECPAGDCAGLFGPSCTCSNGSECVPATGPSGSGQCRSPAGTCNVCLN